MIVVNEFPPSEEDRIRVNLESRYGIYCFFPSASLLMQFASTNKLLLMNPVSLTDGLFVDDASYVSDNLSDPAKSTRF